MTEPKIKGGYILLSRRLIESEIFDKPPLYLKVWIYLLSKAQHKDFKGLKRGQLRTSISEIMNNCSWHVGYRKEIPTKDQIFQILEWMRSPHESNGESNKGATMLTTTRATHGLLVTIVNYGFYQCSDNYEGNGESNNEKVTKATTNGDNINKNDKNVQECNKNDNKRESLSQDAIELCKYWEELKPNESITKDIATLKIFIQKYGFDWTKEAMQITAKNKNRFIGSYVETILKNWSKDGKEEENHGCVESDTKSSPYDFSRYRGKV